jgi:hypothetical protein
MQKYFGFAYALPMPGLFVLIIHDQMHPSWKY